MCFGVSQHLLYFLLEVVFEKVTLAICKAKSQIVCSREY